MRVSIQTKQQRFWLALAMANTFERAAAAIEAASTKIIHDGAYYTPQEAAALTQYSIFSISRAIAAGLLKACGMPTEPRIKGADLHDWMTSRRGRNRSRADLEAERKAA